MPDPIPPMTEEDQSRIALVAGTAFSAGPPIKEKDVFAGRKGEIRRVIDAINQDGRSVLIYGERGVGKTSLANVLSQFILSAQKVRIFAPHIACDAEDRFDTIWRKVFAEGSRIKPLRKLPENVWAEVDGILGSAGEDLKPYHIQQIAHVITRTHMMIVIIDEFDRVGDDYAISLFTDTIKAISDDTTGTTLVLVGVGDTVDDLISEHESARRALEQVLMPRMNASEAADILKKGQKATGVLFSGDAFTLILSLAQGLPHYVHVLGLYATRSAVDDHAWIVGEKHVELAAQAAITGAQQSLIRAYHTATTSPKKNHLFNHVVLACAMAPTDQLGYFAAVDIRAPFQKITGKPYDVPNYAQHLKSLCEDERGRLLQSTGGDRKKRYRFVDPMIQPYIVLVGLKEKRIFKEDVRGLFQIPIPERKDTLF